MRLGKASWLLPTGVTGLTPLAVFGPTELGPSAMERSHAEIQSVSLWVRPLSSLLHRRVVLAATLNGASVTVIQGYNRSWFGAIAVSGHLDCLWRRWMVFCVLVHDLAQGAQDDSSRHQTDHRFPSVSVHHSGYPLDTVPSSRPVPSTPKEKKETLKDRPLPLSPAAPLPSHAAAAAAKAAAAAQAAAAAAAGVDPAELGGAQKQRPAAEPPVALEAVLLRNSTILLDIYGDPNPRRIEGVTAKLRLSTGYRRLELDVGGRVRQRDPNDRGCTMLTVTKRHLRETVSAAERALEAAEVARGGDGGTVRVVVTCGHIGTPGRWPELLVRVIGKNLHAPVFENLLDLPMDINGGRLDGELRIRCQDQTTWDFPELGGSIRARGCALCVRGQWDGAGFGD